MQNKFLQIGVLIIIVVVAILVVVLIYRNPNDELKNSVKTIQESSPENTNKTAPST